MQQWEYLFVYVGYERGLYRAQYINSVEIRDWKNGPEIATYLNQLGEQGWEAIGISQSTVSWQCLLKRPKP